MQLVGGPRVGVPVVVQLAATDVIHSMYLPNFRVKQDAVPGTVTWLTFHPKVPGEYEIACAQHCGAKVEVPGGKRLRLKRADDGKLALALEAEDAA